MRGEYRLCAGYSCHDLIRKTNDRSLTRNEAPDVSEVDKDPDLLHVHTLAAIVRPSDQGDVLLVRVQVRIVWNEAVDGELLQRVATILDGDDLVFGHYWSMKAHLRCDGGQGYECIQGSYSSSLVIQRGGLRSLTE